MEALSLPRRYRTIIIPSSSFQLIVDPGKARQAMKCLYNQLAPGGVLVMPFMLLWKRGDPMETDWKPTGEKVRPDDGALVRRYSLSRYDPETQLEHTEERYEVMRDGILINSEHHKRSPATQEYTQPQALQLYEETGFSDIRMYKGFTRELASVEDWIFTLTGKRP
jgi:hypothetical protein